MNEAKTVFKNTMILAGGTIISEGLRIVYVGMLARYVGQAGMGQIATATAIVPLLIVIASFGLDTLTIRDLAADPTRTPSYVASVTALRLVLGVVFAAALGIILLLSDYSPETQLIIVIYAASYLLDTFFSTIGSVFYAFQKMEYRTALDLSRGLLNVSVSIIGILLGWSLPAIVAVSAVASLARLVVGIFVLNHYCILSRARVDFALCCQMFARALPFALLLCIGIASGNATMLVLSHLEALEEVGIYSAATIPIMLLLTLPTMFMDSVFPMFSKTYHDSPSSLVSGYRFSYRALLLIGFPVGMGVILVSDSVSQILYGEDFSAAAAVMGILSVQLFTMVGYVNGAFLNATGRQSLFAGLRSASVLLNLGLCCVLIPRYHAKGAAAAVAVPAIVDFVMFSAICHRYARIAYPWLTLFKTALCTAALGASGILVLGRDLPVVLVPPVAAAVYGAALVILRVLETEEWLFLGQLLHFRTLQQGPVRE